MSEQPNPENQAPQSPKQEEEQKPQEQQTPLQQLPQESKTQSSSALMPPSAFFQQNQQMPLMQYPSQMVANSQIPPPGYRPPFYPPQQYPFPHPPPYRHPYYPQQPPAYPPFYQPPPYSDFSKRHSNEAEQGAQQVGTQQLFRTHNPSQTQQIVIPNSEICGICEKPGATIKCISICKKFYHKECAERMGMKTIHQSETNGSYFIQCENCLLRVQKCQVCQKQGFVGQQMVKCQVNSCTYFFHKKCLDKEKEIKSPTSSNSPLFICGAHHCQVCSNPFRIDEQIIKCIRCVTAFHDSCKEGQKIQQITSKQFICLSHTQQEQVPTKQQEIQQPQPQVQQDEAEPEAEIEGEKEENQDEDKEIANEDAKEEKAEEEQEQKQEQVQEQQEEEQSESKDQEMEEVKESSEMTKPLVSSQNSQEEKIHKEKQEIYKRMRTGLTTSIETGELIQVQRQVESASFSSNMFRSGMTAQGGMIGPPSSSQSYSQWKKVDPSETLVINSNTLQKINDILSSETKKKIDSENLSFKQVESQWNEEFINQCKGKTIKRVAKIIKKMQGIDVLEKREKALLEAKFEEYRKFINNEYDERVKMTD